MLAYRLTVCDAVSRVCLTVTPRPTPRRGSTQHASTSARYGCIFLFFSTRTSSGLHLLLSCSCTCGRMGCIRQEHVTVLLALNNVGRLRCWVSVACASAPPAFPFCCAPLSVVGAPCAHSERAVAPPSVLVKRTRHMSGKRGTHKASLRAAAMREHAVRPDENETYTFLAESDEEGVWFYQAYNDGIADWAVEHGILGGPLFNPTRMTWIKPSFAWMLYRCGYATKHSQERVLKLKLPHSEVASLLQECACTHGGGGAKGRIQWDPARDLYSSEGRGNSTEPRKMLRERAIQIGLSRELSERFARSILAIVDVSALARRVGDAHRSSGDVRAAMEVLRAELPTERPYMPRCAPHELVRLRLIRAEEQAEEQAPASSSAALGAVSASAAAASGAVEPAARPTAERTEPMVEPSVGKEAAVAPESKRQRSWGERSLLTTLPAGDQDLTMPLTE